MGEKHAYLIIAHNEPELLRILLELIDDERNDIYLHIDKKSIINNYKTLINSVKKSKIRIYKKFKVIWGHQSQVNCEMFLLKEALNQSYSYYHIISGSDLPIKTQDEIHEFFLENRGFEFIHFDSSKASQKDIERIKYYHLLSRAYKISNSKIINKSIFILDNFLVNIQKIIGVNRIKKYYKVMKGCNWCSISYDLAKYIISKEKYIKKLTKHSRCADEIFIQTLVENSKFKWNLYNKEYNNDYSACKRLIEWKNCESKSPNIFIDEDFDKIMNSNQIFARKFSIEYDRNIINKIYKVIKNSKQGSLK